MPSAPRAPQRPFEITRHGDTRVDPYYWLNDRDDEAVLAHLRAENAYLARELAHLAPLEAELFEEIKSRIEETDISRTMASLMPFLGLKTGIWSSDQPNW